VRASDWKFWLVQTHWKSVMLVQPFFVAAVVTQVKIHGEIPAVVSGGVAESVDEAAASVVAGSASDPVV